MAAWLGLLFAGAVMPAFVVFLAALILTPFTGRRPIRAITRLPLLDAVVAKARAELDAAQGVERIYPLGELLDLEQWQDLIDAQTSHDVEVRRWFSPAYRARIQLGLGHPRKALAALKHQDFDFDEGYPLEVEAHLQLNDEKAAEKVMLRSRPPQRWWVRLFQGENQCNGAWALIYRHRGDIRRALYFCEHPLSGPRGKRKELLTAAELLLELKLPVEAAVTMEWLLETAKWVKPEDVGLLADCYRKSGHVAKAERVERALTAKMAEAHSSTALSIGSFE